VHVELRKTLQTEYGEQRQKAFDYPSDAFRPHRSCNGFDADISKDLFVELRNLGISASGAVESARPVNMTLGFE